MKPIVIANWKMNFSFTQACDYLSSLNNYCSYEYLQHSNLNQVKLIFGVPNLYLSGLKLKFADKYHLAAQDISMVVDNYGAYTGETSAKMLHDLNIQYSIIGHSERRKLFNENDTTVSGKAINCIKNGIIPIICVGEPIEIRHNNEHIKYITQQFDHISCVLTSEVIIAYEPVWAIGTNIIPTSNQIKEVITLIRELISTRTCSNIAKKIKIVYGGSVSCDNVGEIMKTNIDGILVGSKSLKTADLMAIINKLKSKLIK